jgi:signal peptidase II
MKQVLKAVLLAAVVIAVDRITKHIVRGHIGLTQQHTVIPGVLWLVHYTNTGVAFDFLSGAGPVVIIVEGLALLVLLVYFARHPTRRGLWIPTGLLVGGALGNLLDRLIDGSVTDFIKFPHWPAFNVADISITVGVITLLLVLELSGRSERR